MGTVGLRICKGAEREERVITIIEKWEEARRKKATLKADQE